MVVFKFVLFFTTVSLAGLKLINQIMILKRQENLDQKQWQKGRVVQNWIDLTKGETVLKKKKIKSQTLTLNLNTAIKINFKLWHYHKFT